ncbi:MAG: magnesium/cobalt transporter CorA [Planctomycetota bacterium]
MGRPKKNREKKRRSRLFRHRATRPGQSPGTIEAPTDAPIPTLTVIAYGPDLVEEKRGVRLEEIRALRGQGVNLWVNVDGLGDASLVQRIGDLFQLHPLALEDVVHVHQRPKIDDYGDQLFLAARMPQLSEELSDEQISLFLGEGYVMTFQERVGDCFGGVRQRLERSGTRLRQQGPSYLAYALVDALVDSYFPVLETLGTTIEELEHDIFTDTGRDNLARIYDLKRKLVLLRRGAWPLRDVTSNLVREEEWFSESSRPFLRDCFDHSLQVIDLIETYRELLSGLLEVHLSQVSNRLNEVMKVLTIIATIFIPLGFIAGVYGMNFNTETSPWNLPELNWTYGYPFALGLMAAVSIALLFFFRRKGWLGAPDE